MERLSCIMHLALYGSHYPGNFIASLANLHHCLKNKGIACILGFPEKARKRDWHSNLCSQGCCVVDLPNPGASKLACAWHIRKFIQQYRPTVVHTHFTQYDIPAAVAAELVPRRLRPRVIWHRHSDVGEKIAGAKRLRCLMKHRILGRHVEHLAVSESIRSLLSTEGAPRSKIHVIENGIDFGRIHVTVEARHHVRAEWHIPADDCVFLMFGWQPIVKGVDVAVEAFSQVRRQHDRCWLVIAGEEKTKRLLAERFPGRADGIIVVPTRPDVNELYSGADVFISASRTEGFSYAAVEAAYCRPVIASDIAGTDHLHDIPGVRFFRPEDAQNLAARMVECLASFAQGQRPAAPDPALVFRRYAVECWTKRCLEFYEGGSFGTAKIVTCATG